MTSNIQAIKNAFEHAQHAQIQIILRMRKVSPERFLSLQHSAVVYNDSVGG